MSTFPLSVEPDPADLYAALMEVVADGILRVDSAGRVREMNHAAAALFDLPEDAPTGRRLGLTVLEATHLRALADLCSEVQQGSQPQEREVKGVGRSERLLRVRATPLPDGGCLLTLTDLTEIVRLRTVRTEFVANVSHELRTPLASIRVTAETLLDGAISDAEYSSRFLNTIIREADRLVRLSEDLLELSRAESGERHRAPFDLRGLVLEIGARLQGYADRRGIAMTLPGAGAPVAITADRHEIDQVLFNLIDNAIKYTPSSGTVTVELFEQPEWKRAVIRVSDTGIGILSEDLPRIFERFWRADRARRFQSGEAGGTGYALGGGGSTSGGTGLGLSIVKHIVEAHGGTVTAESELGQGSRFTVFLPLAGRKDDGKDGITEEAVRSLGQ